MIVLKISMIKFKSDKDSFKLFKGIGFNVVEIDEPERVDEQMEKLINENYKTIVITNEVAGFSKDIITRYRTKQNINIIIAPNKEDLSE